MVYTENFSICFYLSFGHICTDAMITHTVKQSNDFKNMNLKVDSCSYICYKQPQSFLQMKYFTLIKLLVFSSIVRLILSGNI